VITPGGRVRVVRLALVTKHVVQFMAGAVEELGWRAGPDRYSPLYSADASPGAHPGVAPPELAGTRLTLLSTGVSCGAPWLLPAPAPAVPAGA